MTKPRKKETRARRSPEIVTDLVTGEPVRLTSIAARKRDHRVRLFRRRLIRAAPNIDDQKFGPVILSFCRISILSMDSYEFLRKRGLVNADGELRASVDVYRKLVDTQLRMAERLGLTPAALRTLGNSKDQLDLPSAIVEANAREEVSDGEVLDGSEKSRPN
jgi:hypothetical protein